MVRNAAGQAGLNGELKPWILSDIVQTIVEQLEAEEGCDMESGSELHFLRLPHPRTSTHIELSDFCPEC